MSDERALQVITQTNQPAPTPQLAIKLSRAMAAVRPLVLDGENTFHHYHYPTIAQVRERANKALAEAGIAIIPSITRVVRGTRVSDRGKDLNITGVDVQLIICAEEGTYTAQWFGESEDTGDKGIQKAASSAIKSFLSNLLLIPVGEDENDDGVTESVRRNPNYVPPKAEPSPHWVTLEPRRKAFWAWTGDQELSNDEVHTALGVEHLEQFVGSPQDARDAIKAWIDSKIEAENAESIPAEVEPVPTELLAVGDKS